MILCTCEKPSVAKDIAKAIGATHTKHGYLEGNGYIVTWAIGHLIELYYPEDYDQDLKKWSFETLPIIPEQFRRKVIKNVESQFMIVKKLMQRDDIEYIVNCGDAGREGEYIQRLIYEKANNRHPVKRLWLSSFTTKEIKNGFQNLLDSSEKDCLYEEAKCRAEADWLVGINLSRVFTLRYNTLLSVGRVQTPTLKLIVDLDDKIENFKPEPFYEIYAEFKEGFLSKWFDKKESRFSSRNDAQKIVEKCNNKKGQIISLDTKQRYEERPLLYSLDTLQKDANRLYGYGAADVLSIAQTLYEKHKITTYPRTDSNYLSEDMKGLVPRMVKDISNHSNYQAVSNTLLREGLNIGKRMIDNTKISDHHAIVVTENIRNYDLSLLKRDERNILNLIITRILCAVSTKFVYEETNLIVDVENETFGSRAKRVVDLGFRKIEAELIGKQLPKDMESFHVKEGQEVHIAELKIADKQTSPPKPFTEGSLIDAMMHVKRYISEELKDAISERGLGTVATRASIIEKLKKSGYIDSFTKGKTTILHASDKGKKLISLLPESISSPEMTAEWEEQLKRIEEGQLSSESFMNGIKDYIEKSVKQYAAIDSTNKFGQNKDKKESVGTCPFCGSPVYENSKSYYCSNYKNCDFSLWKNNRFFETIGFKLTKSHAKKFLSKGRVLAKNLRSKKGTKYDAYLVSEWGRPYHKFHIEFLK